MSWVVFVTVVADRTQVIVATLCTLPPDAKDGLLSAGVTHSPLVLHTCVEETNITVYVRALLLLWPSQPLNYGNDF